MKEDKNILDKINRKSGMTVPDNYFADFAEKMMQNLPEKQEPIIAKPPTAWQRVRAYVYLVAMFAGIWCMVKMVDLMGSNTPGTPSEAANSAQILAQAIEDESFISDYCYEDIDEYSLLESMYEDGYEAGDLIIETSY
ncbi:MAG: hypothetical protein IJE73_08150 [Muribaculaceae bacterium]|nr:hypothetical protein [Muribaculaceae bacterium]